MATTGEYPVFKCASCTDSVSGSRVLPSNMVVHVLKFDPGNSEKPLSVIKVLTTDMILDDEIPSSGNYFVGVHNLDRVVLIWNFDEDTWALMNILDEVRILICLRRDWC